MTDGVRTAEPRLPEIDAAGRTGALEVDLGLFSPSAVLRAAYKLTGCAHVFVETVEEGAARVVVTFRAKGGRAIEAVIGDFANELIDQRIREEMAREMAPIREMVVAQAFAEGNLLDALRDEGDFEEDPLGIGEFGGGSFGGGDR